MLCDMCTVILVCPLLKIFKYGVCMKGLYIFGELHEQKPLQENMNVFSHPLRTVPPAQVQKPNFFLTDYHSRVIRRHLNTKN